MLQALEAKVEQIEFKLKSTGSTNSRPKPPGLEVVYAQVSGADFEIRKPLKDAQPCNKFKF